MGVICCTKNQQPASGDIETEREVSIPIYSSSADKEFSKLETKENLLRDIVFSDYIYSLSQFSLENATVQDDYTHKPTFYSMDQPFYNEELTPDLFQSFIENKIFKHPNLYVKAGENEDTARLFKDAMLNIQKSLISKLDQNDKNNGVDQPNNVFRKSHAIALGLLYTSGTNVSKIKFLHNLFSQGGSLKKTNAFSEFLLALFLIPSYCMLYTRNKLADNGNLPEFSKETMKKILDKCELKDTVNLLGITMKMIFPVEDKSYSYPKFKNLFEGGGPNSIGWMITPRGIRLMLEKNNV